MKWFIGIVVLALAVAIYAADSDVVPVEAVEDDGAAPTGGYVKGGLSSAYLAYYKQRAQAMAAARTKGYVPMMAPYKGYVMSPTWLRAYAASKGYIAAAPASKGTIIPMAPMTKGQNVLLSAAANLKGSPAPAPAPAPAPYVKGYMPYLASKGALPLAPMTKGSYYYMSKGLAYAYPLVGTPAMREECVEELGVYFYNPSTGQVELYSASVAGQMAYIKDFNKCIADKVAEAESGSGDVDSTTTAAPAVKPWTCYMKPSSGMCMAYMTRYYYNSYTQRCEMFVYGGCGGNKNNYISYSDCVEACQ